MRECTMKRKPVLALINHPRSFIGWGAVLLMFPWLWGCAKPINIPPLSSEEIAHFQAAANYPHASYRIEPGDTLQIRYPFHQEMNQDELVRPDGKVTATMLGEIMVAGMSTSDLEALLRERTSHRLRNPEVTVMVSRLSDKSVFVGGEVGKPGVVPYRLGLSPLQAVIASGGFRDTARVDSVILIRTGGEADTFVSRKLNLAEVVTQGTKEPIYLAPQDVLFVPRTAIADANLWVRQHITDLIPFLRGSVGANARVQ